MEWGRFLRELGAEIPLLQDFAGEEEEGVTAGKPTLPSSLRNLDPTQLETKIGEMVQGSEEAFLHSKALISEETILKNSLVF